MIMEAQLEEIEEKLKHSHCYYDLTEALIEEALDELGP